jgi:Family of unknown function (DUF6064)
MTAQFTIEQFFAVFAAYNAAIWPAQIGAYILGIVAVAALWLRRPKLIVSILALMWLWNAIGYHYLFFSSINPAAKLFAGLFALEAVVLAASTVGSRSLSFRIARDFRTTAGLTFNAFALAIYPALGFWAGHGLMAGPIFGVAPCPTTIFTIGFLLLARGRWVIWLSVIPVLWSLVGLAAALQLGMFEDLALPLASLVLLVTLVFEAYRVRYPAGSSQVSKKP